MKSRLVFKHANSRKRERRNSISFAKSVLTSATLLDISLTEPDASGDAGKQVSMCLPENFAAGDMWRQDPGLVKEYLGKKLREGTVGGSTT